MREPHGRGVILPRYVDADQRRSDILDAAAVALSEEGYARMSLRSLAKRMGGSSTLVTHYYPTKTVLVTALVDRILDEAETIKETVLAVDGRRERVRTLISEFLPMDPESLQHEKVRMALLPYRDTDEAIGRLFDRTEPAMRDIIRVGLQDAVAAKDLDGTVDVVRAWMSGVALSAVEHPEIWSPERQTAACERFLQLLPLKIDIREGPSGGRNGSRPSRVAKARRK
jgi:AcrR family transcriptional regulator